MAKDRIRSFDALRFLAAVVVCMCHSFSVRPTAFFNMVLGWGAFDPKSAVAFFFVLSGLVLHLSWRGNVPTPAPYGRFLVRRWFRIYPLYYVSLGLGAAALCLPLSTVPALLVEDTTSIILTRDHRDAMQWLLHLVLIAPGLDFDFINPPIWTLAAEMRVSLIFPVLSFVVSRLSLRWGFLLMAGSFFLSPRLASMTVPTVAVIPLFLAGAWIAQHRQALARLQQSGWLVVLAVGSVIYALSPSLGRATQTLHSYIAGLGGCLVLVAVENCHMVRRFIETRMPVVLNDISYGVYVLHFPVLLGVAYAFAVIGAPAWLFVPVCISLTILVSVVFNRLVELPMISLGRKICLVRSKAER